MKLEKYSVVCCLGSSTTQHGYWVHDVENYFLKYRPEDKTTFYNCGVGGDTARLSRFRLEEDVLFYNPTHVFIMFGMNDIRRELYAPGLEATPELLEKRDAAINEYEDSLLFLAKYFRDRNIMTVFGIPASYDTVQPSPSANFAGCADAISRCADIVVKVACECGCECMDIGGELSKVKKSWDANGEWIYAPDRVHPTRVGYGIIAKIFLKNAGFDEIELPLCMEEWKAAEPEINGRLFDLEQTIRDIAFIDWGRFHPLHGEYLGREYKIETMLRIYSEPDCAAWLKKAVENYFKYNDRKDRLRQQLITAKNRMY
jgi:lysophospholipase L1-like esterase